MGYWRNFNTYTHTHDKTEMEGGEERRRRYVGGRLLVEAREARGSMIGVEMDVDMEHGHGLELISRDYTPDLATSRIHGCCCCVVSDWPPVCGGYSRLPHGMGSLLCSGF
jgi:hypothetical protein